MRLVSGEKFVDHIRKLPADKQDELLQLALAGDYRTPTCPQCGVKMTLRQGRESGSDFWGCPRCVALNL